MQQVETATSDDLGITAEQWERFEEDGYLRLARLLEDTELEELRQRANDIMLGKADVNYEELLMQLDGSSAQTKGFKGATLGYRKIQDLELDRVFRSYLQRAGFRRLCERVYGRVPVAVFRAMLMNKPAGAGTFLAWHQDRWSYLDRDPLLTVWTALDASTADNGALHVVPGSHLRGVLNPENASGFLNEAQVARYCRDGDQQMLEVEAGDALLLHNWLLHASGTNASPRPRRAFSVCYMDARTMRLDGGEPYRVVFPL